MRSSASSIATIAATIESGRVSSGKSPRAASIAADIIGAEASVDEILLPPLGFAGHGLSVYVADGAADPRPIYVEVKNTTWSDGDLALFPDTVTERGQKHLVELTALVPGARAVLVPCLSRGDVTRFAPGDSADPRYGELFRAAAAAGVEVLPCRYSFDATAVTWLGLAAQAW